LAWFVGLDADATRSATRYGTAEEVREGDLDKVLAIFRLEFLDGRMSRGCRRTPVWLFMTMSPDRSSRMKPQTDRRPAAAPRTR
jgi:hypothetical protein